jgi:DNA helicase II / ATP-dependent DNA helicase PcrA
MVSDPGLAGEIGGRFDHVLVDEYQDTNRLQASILLALKPSCRGLTVVGDDAQSIYSFRAATVRNILDFPAEFSPQAEIITLDRNYRSTQPILTAANRVIDLARERFTKDLWTDPCRRRAAAARQPS